MCALWTLLRIPKWDRLTNLQYGSWTLNGSDWSERGSLYSTNTSARTRTLSPVPLANESVLSGSGPRTVHTHDLIPGETKGSSEIRIGATNTPVCRRLAPEAFSQPPTSQTAAMARQNIVSTQEIEHLIAQGEPIVVHEGYALNISTWINHHPGGRLAILHMVGRDATDEINMCAVQR